MTMDTLVRWVERYSRAAEEDGYSALLETSGWDPATVTDPEEVGQRCLKAQVEAVTWLVAFHGLNRAEPEEAQQEIDSFLDRQRYGDTPARGVRYSLRLVGPCCPLLFVNELREVDLEDLRSVIRYDGIEITDHRADLSEEAARELVKEVLEDLTFDGDQVELRPEVRGNRLFMAIEWVEGWD
jgi:hypothetical protein